VADSHQQVPVFKTAVDLVHVGVTVSDRKGGLVAELTKDDFEVYEDGKKQTIQYFAIGDPDASDQPEMHLGLLLDVSGSMGEDMSFTKTASIKFLNTLTDAVDITVVDFDTEVRSARYGQSEFARLIERIRQKKADGYTALYDAIGTYLDGAAGQSGRKIMLVYTDGGDTRSSLHWHELLGSAEGLRRHRLRDRHAGAPDAIDEDAAAHDHSTDGRSHRRAGLLSLGREGTRQGVRESRRGNPRAVHDRLSVHERKDRRRVRKVEVKVARKDLRVRSRRGYFAPYKK
jgi:Ca-activated chloride channel family protein